MMCYDMVGMACGESGEIWIVGKPGWEYCVEIALLWWICVVEMDLCYGDGLYYCSGLCVNSIVEKCYIELVSLLRLNFELVFLLIL